MNKNFEDILNEKIGKHQSKKAASSTQHITPNSSSTDIKWDLLQHLKRSVNINISIKSHYNLANTDFVETKPNNQSPKNTSFTDEIGYFEKSDSVIFALMFVKNMDLDIRDGISKKQLKKMFRKMLLKHHPDTSNSAMSTEQFTQMLEQFKILEKAWKPHKEAA
jgi:hypothetical protein